MFIPNVSSINPGIYAANAYRTSVCNTQPAFKGGLLSGIFSKPDRDTFEKSSELILPGLKNFTVEEYKQLSEEEKEAIRNDIKEYIDIHGKEMDKEIYKKMKIAKNFKKELDSDVMYNDLAASGIKQSLDRTYGEGKYVFIPIGRSLSSIGQSLSYKIGEDNVKKLPMSKAARFIDMRNFKEDADKFNEYLDSIGLSKDEVENSGKTYIFADYCYTGASRIGVQHLFESDKVWGEQPNVKFEDIRNILEKAEPDKFEKDTSVSGEELWNKVHWALSVIDYKPYSLVKKCDNLANTQEAVIKPENYSPVNKIFMFKLLDREMQK